VAGVAEPADQAQRSGCPVNHFTRQAVAPEIRRRDAESGHLSIGDSLTDAEMACTVRPEAVVVPR